MRRRLPIPVGAVLSTPPSLSQIAAVWKQARVQRGLFFSKSLEHLRLGARGILLLMRRRQAGSPRPPAPVQFPFPSKWFLESVLEVIQNWLINGPTAIPAIWN